MSAPPKPAKRPRKPRKPLKRSSTPIARKSRPARVRRSEAGQAKHRKDRAWSEAIHARGACEIHGAACRGRLEAAHGISRRYSATRHDLRNGFLICAEAHRFYTEHPSIWTDWLIDRLGASEYQELSRKAQGRV